MIPMLLRAIQILLVFLGVLFLLAIFFAFPSSSGNSTGAFDHLSTMFGAILDIVISFLCFIGAYRIGKWRKKAK